MPSINLPVHSNTPFRNQSMAGQTTKLSNWFSALYLHPLLCHILLISLPFSFSSVCISPPVSFCSFLLWSLSTFQRFPREIVNLHFCGSLTCLWIWVITLFWKWRRSEFVDIFRNQGSPRMGNIVKITIRNKNWRWLMIRKSCE